MRGSRNFRQPGGGGGVVVCLCFAFFLVLGLVYRSHLVNFKEKYHFSRFWRGSKFFQGGDGGSRCLFPIETQITCDCPGEGGKVMRWPLALVLVFLQLCCMFSVEPRNKIVSWTYCMTVSWFIQHLLQFAFAFFNHSIKIAQFLFAGGHFFSFPNHFDRWCFSSSM